MTSAHFFTQTLGLLLAMSLAPLPAVSMGGHEWLSPDSVPASPPAPLPETSIQAHRDSLVRGEEPQADFPAPLSAHRDSLTLDSIQDLEEDDFFAKTMLGVKRIVQSGVVRIGLNVGATAPLGLPEGVHPLSYSPGFSPVIAFDRDIRFSRRLFMTLGIRLEYKGMRARAAVHDFHTNVRQEDENGNVTRFSGNFTGENVSQFNNSYATLPVHLGMRFTPRFSLRVGAYVSYLLSGQFTGSVENGYVWTDPEQGQILSQKIAIDRAEFNFSENIRSWDVGLDLIARQRLTRHFYVEAGLAVSMVTVFEPDFRGIEMPMRNMYGSLSVGYRFREERPTSR